MGKDKRPWRKLVKKLQRQKKRQNLAQSTLSTDEAVNQNQFVDDKRDDDNTSDSRDQFIAADDRDFFLSRAEWEQRDRQEELASIMKQVESERLAEIQAENQRKIRAEWEAKMEQEKKLMEEKERLERQLKEKQETEFSELLSFLSGDIETPPTKYLFPENVSDSENICYYFDKTAACRFYERCNKLHLRPTLSTSILIPNFFSHFKLEQSTRDEYDTDLGLEYEDQELQKEFLEFYNDVVPELRTCGTLLQFKVCCNLEPHLRGNVYIQYSTMKEAVQAYRKFNGRFFNGKQLSLQFIKLDSWRAAICGAYLRKACVKGRTCNYLHVFRNPTKEFVKADHDWKEMLSHRSIARPSTSQSKTNESFVNSLINQKIISTSEQVSTSTEFKINEKLNINKELEKSSVQEGNKSAKIMEPVNAQDNGLSNTSAGLPLAHRRRSSPFPRKRKKEKKDKKKSKKHKKHKKQKHAKKKHKRRHD